MSDQEAMKEFLRQIELTKHMRNATLEEVAQELERFTLAFGVDTVHSFASFVRGMKNDT